MAYGESNGHVINGVMWPCKVKVMTQICLGPKSRKQLEMLFLQQSLITRYSTVRQYIWLS